MGYNENPYKTRLFRCFIFPILLSFFVKKRHFSNPFHSKEWPKGTENSILKQAELKYPRYFTRSIFCCDVTTYLCFH